MAAPEPPAGDAAARRYHRRQLALSIVAALLSAAVLAAWLWTGAAVALAAALEARLAARGLVVAGMFLAVGGSTAAVALPLDVVRGHLLPRRAGLRADSFAAWLADKGKALALGGVLGLGVFELTYATLAWSPGWWWLWSAAGLTAGSVLLTAVLPIWIAPLFYRLTPLDDPALRARLLALARRMSVAAADVAVADVSRKGRTANAAVVGLGPTRHIVLSDTLLAGFPAEEVEVILAHELAHHARGHLAQGLLVQAALLVVTLALAHAALGRLAGMLGLGGSADPAGLPLLALLLSGLGLAVTPAAAAWSRQVEREADAAALELTRAPFVFVAAMERLATLNLAERRPGRLRSLLSATHPSIEERIARAHAAAERLAGVA